MRMVDSVEGSRFKGLKCEAPGSGGRVQLRQNEGSGFKCWKRSTSLA